MKEKKITSIGIAAEERGTSVDPQVTGTQVIQEIFVQHPCQLLLAENKRIRKYMEGKKATV